MRIPAVRILKIHRISILRVSAFALFAVFGITGYFKLEEGVILQDPALLSVARRDMLGAILGYGLLLAGLQWLSNRIALRPTKRVLDAGKKIASEGIGVLSNAIGELSQGDMTKEIRPERETLPDSGQPALNQIIDIFNAMQKNLGDAYQAFNNITGIPCKRLFYVGSDPFLEGRRCGEMMGRCLKGGGRIIVTAESFGNINLDLRRRGFLSTIREKYSDVEVIATLDATAAQGIAYEVGREALKKHPDVTGIYVASGSSAAQFAKAVVDAGRSGQIKIVCHDLVDETMRYIQDGVITATLSQNSPAQGHDPVVHMYNHLSAGWNPVIPFLLTEMEEVHADNVNSFWREGQGIQISKEARDKLAKPIRRTADKPLRIAFLGRDDTAFWQSINRGVEEARNTLRGLPVTVDGIVPPKVREVHRITADIYGPAIEKVVSDQYDGLITMASDQGFIPYINQAVDAGIPVGLYNSDPTSLRGLIVTISSQAVHLLGVSENLASSTAQTSEATVQIQNAMDHVARSARSQNDDVSKTAEVLEKLLTNIVRVRKDTEQSAREAEITIGSVVTGTEAMNRTLKTMKSIEKSVSGTWGIVEELGKHSERIDAVVDLIDDIASRVNVLALNAAIEATRAGEFGAGFMVVAQEIRSLAKKTAEGTREVARLIESVQSDIVKVDRVMSGGLAKLEQTSKLADESIQVVAEIQKRVETDKHRILSISKAMQEMEESSLNVGQAMQNVGTVSQRNMVAVQQVNELTRNMTEQLETVTNLAKSLETMAGGEQRMLAKFSLAEADTNLP
ncbi:MAG TPA: hypothetical protein ENN17_07290 [bacterium]|nr:hypothetical protein [bacterium]